MLTDLSSLAFAATDLWTHYRAAVHKVYLPVAIVADGLYIVQNLHAVLHDIRYEAQKTAADEYEPFQVLAC